MKAASENLIYAALVWDAPALNRSGDDDAKAFFKALDLRTGWWEQTSAETPLGVAAEAIGSELRGEPDDAARGFDALSDSSDQWTRLLGLCLWAWSDYAQAETRIETARGEVERISDPERRARLLGKLSYAAFNHGWDEAAEATLLAAVEAAPEGSMLYAHLRQEATNLLGEPLLTNWAFEADTLTAYEWIDEAAIQGAREALAESVEALSESPWRRTIRLGAGSIHRVLAAEVQARWAGALWLRGSLQKQLAAQLVLSGADSPADYVTAVSLWGLASGARLSQLIDTVEPHFDRESAQRVVKTLNRGGRFRVRFDPPLLEASLAMWDLLAPDVAMDLLDKFKPTVGDHPLNRDIATLWSVMSLIEPDAWLKRFLALNDDEAAALLRTTSPHVAERLPEQAARRLLDLLNQTAAPDVPVLRAALYKRFGKTATAEEFAHISPTNVAEVARIEKRFVSVEALHAARDALVDEVAAVASDATEGRASLGGPSPFVALALASSLSGEIGEEGKRLLIQVSLNEGVPRDIRHDAIRTICRLAFDGSIDGSELETVAAEAPLAGAEAIFGEYSSESLSAAKVQLGVILEGAGEGTLAKLLVLARSSDVRVRTTAIEACTIARRTNSDFLLESIVVSALFDPDQEVVARALEGFREFPPTTGPTQTAFAVRVTDLFRAGPRELRIIIASIASQGLGDGLEAVTEQIRHEAKQDRSFEVRRAVAAREG